MFVYMLCTLRTLLPCVLFMTKTSIVLSAIWDYEHVCDVVVYSTQVYSTIQQIVVTNLQVYFVSYLALTNQ